MQDCLHCGVDTDAIGDFYMVRDDVWFAATRADLWPALVPDKYRQSCLDCL